MIVKIPHNTFFLIFSWICITSGKKILSQYISFPHINNINIMSVRTSDICPAPMD